MSGIQSDLEEFVRASGLRTREHYLLQLYVTGTTQLSNRAVVNIRKLCETYLAGRYRLEVIDVLQNPTLAAAQQIIAIPTLLKTLPLPERRFVGDMSESDRILQRLDIRVLTEGEPRDV